MFLGEYEEALQTYDRLLSLLPDYVDPSGIYNDVGLLMGTLGQYESALDYLNKALIIDSNKATHYFLRK